jgi:hypothetical protein
LPDEATSNLVDAENSGRAVVAKQELARGKSIDMVEKGSISAFSTLSMAGLSRALTMRGEGEIVEDGTIPLDHRLEPGKA